MSPPGSALGSVADSLSSPVAAGVAYGRVSDGVETGSLYIQDHVSRDFTILREDAYAFPVLGVPAKLDARVFESIDVPLPEPSVP